MIIFPPPLAAAAAAAAVGFYSYLLRLRWLMDPPETIGTKQIGFFSLSFSPQIRNIKKKNEKRKRRAPPLDPALRPDVTFRVHHV